MTQVTLGARALDACFPYHLVVDSSLRVVSCGPVLARLLPELHERPALEAHFEVVSGEGPWTPAREDASHAPIVLRSRRRPSLELRGHVAGVEGDGSFLLVASPRRTGEKLRRRNAELERRVAEHTARLEEERRHVERVEDELRLAHRLEAVGQLAAGVAHEINTPIQYVGDSLHFLRSACHDIVPMLARLRGAGELARQGRADEIAAEIDAAWEEADAEFLLGNIPKALDRTFDGIERVTSIVRAMKAFAHPGSEDKAPADLNEGISNTLVVARNEYKYIADVDKQLGTLPPVFCSVGELNQVFLNLVVNAAHAISDVVRNNERGTITVRSRAEGETVAIEIEDTGGGIPPELRERVFDPFFTTKPVGKGTGQGLTLARSIVNKHGGTLSFHSNAGKGTRFLIRLPIGAEASCPT